MKKIISAVLCMVMVLGLCACGNAKSAAYVTDAYYTESCYPASAPSMVSEAAGAPAMEEAYRDAGLSNGTENLLSKEAGQETDSGFSTEKIIYSADATIETTDFSNVVEAIQKMVRDKNGFIESSSINDNNFYNKSRGYQSTRSAQFTIRIPGNRFSEVMNSLDTFGNVPYSYTYTQNVTSQYYDIQARAEAYQAQEKRLIELLEKAENIEDIIAIEDKLSDVRYSIDRLQSNLNDYDRKVAYSTIYLTVEEVVEYTPVEPVKRTFGEKLGASIRAGLSGALDFLENLILWLAESLPTLLILGVILFGVIVGIRKVFRKRKIGKKAKTKAEDQKAE